MDVRNVFLQASTYFWLPFALSCEPYWINRRAFIVRNVVARVSFSRHDMLMPFTALAWLGGTGSYDNNVVPCLDYSENGKGCFSLQPIPSARNPFGSPHSFQVLIHLYLWYEILVV